MRNLIALPLLGGAVILQSTIVSRISLLSGYADLILVILAAWALQEQVTSAWLWALVAGLFTSFVTHLPWPVVFFGYFACVWIARRLTRRIWQAPIAAMFGVTFLGTVTMHMISYLVLLLLGHRLPVGDVIGWITIPSLLLNMILAVPVFVWIRDLAGWAYPATEVV